MAKTEAEKAYAREWRRKRRIFGVQYLGGICITCATTSDLQIDHIDPRTKNPLLKKTNKKTGNGQLWQWSWTRILTELDKCQLLCRACHKAKTSEERLVSQV